MEMRSVYERHYIVQWILFIVLHPIWINIVCDCRHVHAFTDSEKRNEKRIAFLF